MTWAARVGICLALMSAGCSDHTNAAVKGRKFPDPAWPEAWSVTCTDPGAKEPAWLSNGLIGVRVGRDGTPTRLFRADRHEAEGEERLIAGSVEAVSVEIDAKPLTIDSSKPYAQRLDFKTLELATEFDTAAAHVKRVALVEPGAAVLMERMTLTMGKPAQVTVSARPGVECLVTAGATKLDTGGRDWTSKVGPGDVHIESKYRFGDAQAAVRTVLTDIEIEGPVDDQQAIRSFQTYLRMALPSAGLQPAPLSPHGLSADHYLGHVFWDADVWVFPVLALLDPQAARAIPAYRLHHFGAAKENYTSWWRERQRDGTFQPGAAKFPWQSAVSGGETAHDEFREEVHINGAVLWGLTLAERLGMAESGQVKSVERSLALFWRSLLTPRPGTKQFDIKRVFGVDEFRSTDNDLVTNILAQWTLNGRRHQIPKGISEVYLPRAAGNPIFQTYEGDTQRTFKQAAAVLSIYPYQFPAAEANAKAMMDHYASRIDQRGPAMTEAIHATIWARMGQTEKAYDEWKGAWREFTGALLMFSEHRNRDRSYFATGAAGCLQTVLYGFLGFRIDYKQVPGAVWSLQLKSGGWLSVKPNLPKAWTRVTVRNLQLLGRSYTLEITHNGVQVTEGES